MKRIQKGFSLIEVMIAVLVLSGAIMAMAYLQVIGLRNANSAYMRSQATMLAYDIVDRIRANRAGTANYDLLISAATPVADATIATADKIDWRNSIADTLPNGAGGIEIDSGVAAVTITWFDNSQDATSAQPQTQTFTYSTRL